MSSHFMELEGPLQCLLQPVTCPVMIQMNQFYPNAFRSVPTPYLRFGLRIQSLVPPSGFPTNSYISFMFLRIHATDPD